MTTQSGGLSRSTLLMFSFPAVLQGFMHVPAQSLVQGIYAKHAGLPLAALGTAVMVTRIFDGVTDPLIGAAADAWHRRTGTHKHFVALGTLVTLIGLWQLYRPPHDVSIAYFTGWFMLAYLGWTITEVPYRAWSLALSSEYTTRTRIQTWLAMTTGVGTFAFYFIPLVAHSLGLVPNTELNMSTLSMCAVVVAVTMPVVNLICIWRVPDGVIHEEKARVDWRELLRAITSNGPYIYFTLMFLAAGMALAIGEGVGYLFMDALGLTDKMAILALLAAPVTFIGMPMWAAICKRLDRQKVWACALAACALCAAGRAFVPPGPDGLVPMVALLLGMLLFGTCTYVVAPSTVGDIVDYGRLKLGRDHSSFYIAFYALITKAMGGFGIAIGFFLLDVLGYDATARTQSASGMLAIHLINAWLPAAGIMLSVPFVWRFPITRCKHDEIVQALQSRDAAAGNP